MDPRIFLVIGSSALVSERTCQHSHSARKRHTKKAYADANIWSTDSKSSEWPANGRVRSRQGGSLASGFRTASRTDLDGSRHTRFRTRVSASRTSGSGAPSSAAGARLAKTCCTTGTKCESTSTRASLSLDQPSFARITAVAAATTISSLSAAATASAIARMKFQRRWANARSRSSALTRSAKSRWKSLSVWTACLAASSSVWTKDEMAVILRS